MQQNIFLDKKHNTKTKFDEKSIKHQHATIKILVI
jgi:hypothetical protein